MGSYRAAWTAGSFLARAKLRRVRKIDFCGRNWSRPSDQSWRIDGDTGESEHALGSRHRACSVRSRNHINAHHGVGAGLSCTSTPGPHRRAKDAAGIKHPRGSRQGGARPPTALRHGTGRRPLGACHWGGSCFPAH